MHNSNIHTLGEEAGDLLKQLIAIPSLSGEENKTADSIENFLQQKGVHTQRLVNNIWCVNKYFDSAKRSVLLCSHHDTVAPNTQYTRDPYAPTVEDGKLYGLGSTDAGASLVSLAGAFLYFYEATDLAYNIVFVAAAEEEISGLNGVEKLFSDNIFKQYFVHPGSFAVVGEPTQLQLAVAEKGLLVLDCMAHGKAGHAARDEGENAVYKAMKAIEWFQQYKFPKSSSLLGETKMTVTSVHTENKAHNVVPPTCSFVVDVRVTELYTHDEIIETIRKNVDVEIQARSVRLRSSSIDIQHPVVQAGISLGKSVYGSPTLSDQALIPLPSLKCGPGDSAQSHSADEFVAEEAISEAVRFYIQLLSTTMAHTVH